MENDVLSLNSIGTVAGTVAGYQLGKNAGMDCV